MQLQNVTLQQQNTFFGSKITRQANVLLKQCIKNSPNDIDCYNAIKSMPNVKIDYYGELCNGIPFLEIRKTQKNNGKLLVPALSLERIQKAITRYTNI